MKPSTYNETVLIVRAWVAGNLKGFLVAHSIGYDCAKKRISRFRKDYPAAYKRLYKLSPFVP